MQAFFNDIRAHIAHPPAAQTDRVILANMHALPSIATLFGTLIDAGFRPENILFIAKPYSTIKAASKDLRAQGITCAPPQLASTAGRMVDSHINRLTYAVSRFVAKLSRPTNFTLLDSGGHLTQCFDLHYPGWPRFSVQLTSSGSRKFAPGTPDLIDIGSETAKKDSESPLIARTIVANIHKAVPALPHKTVCVIGTGAIGNAVTTALRTMNIKVSQISGLADGGKVPEKTSIVIGATGYDQSEKILSDVAANRRLSLFSCSSWDVEFAALLHRKSGTIQFAAPQNRGAQNDIRIPDTLWKVYNGGCPINFDRQHEMAETPEGEKAIALTRGLTLAAALRPHTYATHAPTVLRLYEHHYG